MEKKETEILLRLQFLLKKKKFIDKWRNKSLRFLLTEIGPKLSNTLDYYLIEDYYQVIKQLNEPFQPCMNYYEKYNNMFVSLIITQVRTIRIIRKVLNKVSAYDRNNNKR
jgi:hypothetical protein